MKKNVIRFKYFLRRNWPSWFLLALLVFQFKFNHETVTRTQDAHLDRARKAEKDSLYNSLTARDFRQQWQDSRAMLISASASMVRLNNTAADKGKEKANAYDNKIAKNDSLIEAKADKYQAWLAKENAKIDKKYDALKHGRSALPISDRAGFALMIPIIGAACIGLTITMHRLRKDNPSPLLPVFEVYGGFGAIVAQVADFFMLKKRALDLLQDSDYALFGALAYSSGVLAAAIIVYYNDKKKLHAEMLEEFERSKETEVVAQTKQHKHEAEEIDARPAFGLFRGKQHPLLALDLSGYNSMLDMPNTAEDCCEIFAAFEMQYGRSPQWLSTRKLSEHLAQRGVKISNGSIQNLKDSFKQRKAA